MKNGFIKLISELLDCETLLGMDDRLVELATWDSLGIISTISMVDEEYHILINREDLETFITVGDIWSFIESRIAR